MTQKTAKGNYYLGNKTFAVKEFSIPELGPKEVLIKNMAAGICGTDVHIYNGEPGSAQVLPPVVLGHENSGIVMAVGCDVTTVSVGDHVALDPNVYCGKCAPCKMGKKQNCEHLFAYGVNANGGFAEICVVPETQCFLLNPNISFDEGAMMEPLACVMHGIDRVGILPGQTVVVIGGGAIGLLMVQMAKLSGASCVVLSEPVEMRREIGMKVGADGTINPFNDDLKEKLFEISGRKSADVVIECVGNPKAVQQAFRFAGFGATILLFSVPSPDTLTQISQFDLYKNEWKIMGSFINPDTNQRAVNLINSGRLKLRELITHTYPMKDVEAAILKQTDIDSIKVMVHPQE